MGRDAVDGIGGKGHQATAPEEFNSLWNGRWQICRVNFHFSIYLSIATASMWSDGNLALTGERTSPDTPSTYRESSK
jgi:hypothetical protein